TPSGRLIQRDYSNVSLYDYYYHFDQAVEPHSEVRLTDGGREVYGGGGIMPDVRIPEEKLTPVGQTLEQRGTFFDFSKYYLGVHKTIPENFTADDQVVNEFKGYLAKEKITVSNPDFESNLDYIKTHIRMQLVGMIYGQNQADRIAMESDPLVQKALSSLPQASELLANAKKYMASRGQPRNLPQQ
ncbi:MAG TPA: S41 family peptidase, partial [Terriglobia bacterium]|nr:S41 family peptidase [Terriglobia bacterium]